VRTGNPEADRVDTVDITIPPKPEYVSIARLAAAAIADRQAFSYDEIEDLKIAVSEDCSAFIAPRGRTKHPITLHFFPEHSALAVWIETSASQINPTRSVPWDARRRPMNARSGSS
jgi:anti-sigma regulatory factor (Ser/Thr protein kinase)